MSDTENIAEAAGGGADLTARRYGVYAALKYVPVALYAAFIVLAFIAFALPVAFYRSGNSGIAVDSPGNIYTALFGLLDLDKHIYNSVITLYVAVGIAVLYAAFAAAVCFTGKFGKRNTKDGIGATFAGNVCSGFYVVYIIFAALELIVLCRIFAMDAGLGVIGLGASTVTVLIGEAVVIIASVVCEAIRWRMETKEPALREVEQKKHAKNSGVAI